MSTGRDMTVYVDDMRRTAAVAGRKDRWSHLMADNSEELFAFAVGIGLRPEWVQKPGTYREHFDVTDAIRRRALAFGAVPVGFLALGKWARQRRATLGPA
ncbi:DUF4031 domain-containing protein [Marisediminicola sp. LYQ134]|uniref:DUF4031 domain-containing protein n=1 Tax=Marisediminicola sp. LYQ134 TaxID=3391061 RepID=UPI003983C52A